MFGALQGEAIEATVAARLLAQGRGDPRALRGRVTLDDRPVSDAVVSLFLLNGSSYSRTIATKTDANGNYRFDGLTGGNYVMLTSSRGGTRLYQGKLLIGQEVETVKDVKSTSNAFGGVGKLGSQQSNLPVLSPEWVSAADQTPHCTHDGKPLV